jgi:nucleotide-binding universal stress UspA family protein
MYSKSAALSELIQFRHILIATDFSDSSRKALRYAAAIARFHGARLYIVHVLASIGYRLVRDEEVQAAELTIRDLRQFWNKLGDNDEFRPIELTLIVCEGEVSVVLEDLIHKEHIDLVVLGARGRTGLSKVIFGSVTENIFRKATCPVLTVGPSSSPDWPEREVGAEEAILFPTDFGDASLAALPYAVSVAKRSHSKLILLHVVESVPHAEGTSISGNVVDSAAEEELRRVGVQRLKHLIPNDLRLEPELYVEFGRPVDAILKEAARTGAGLIVLGLHHKSLFPPPAHLPSSIAYGLAIEAKCPVLTVRT